MNCKQCHENLGRCHYNRKFCDNCVAEKEKAYQKKWRGVSKRKLAEIEACKKIMEWAENKDL